MHPYSILAYYMFLFSRLSRASIQRLQRHGLATTKIYDMCGFNISSIPHSSPDTNIFVVVATSLSSKKCRFFGFQQRTEGWCRQCSHRFVSEISPAFPKDQPLLLFSQTSIFTPLLLDHPALPAISMDIF